MNVDISLSDLVTQAVLETRTSDTEIAFEKARMALIDYLAVSFAAAGEPSIKRLKKYLVEDGVGIASSKEPCLSIEKQALFYGFLSHYLDYDDTSSVIRGHGSAVLFSALLALSKQYKPENSSQRFLTAYVVGMEIMGRLSVAVGNLHYERGYHNTSTLGILASAVASSYYLCLSREEFLSAIGIAVSMVGGTRVNFGTETKPLQVGIAAEKGVEAALLAKAGLKASQKALDGPLGFFSLYGSGNTDVKRIMIENWGKSWHLLERGLWFKRYTFCSGAMQLADAVLEIRQKYELEVDNILKVDICFNPNGDAALIHRKPKTGEEGRFSAEYICTIGLLDSLDNSKNFEPVIINKEFESFMAKVTRSYTEVIKPHPKAEPNGRLTVVKVTLKDGTVLESRVDFPKGSPGNPFTKKEAELKFLKYCSGNKGKEILERIYSLGENEELENLLALIGYNLMLLLERKYLL